MVASISFSGDVLPPQLIYQGKTERCHPNGVDFDNSWLIDHSESHWTTKTTFLRYIEQLLIEPSDLFHEVTNEKLFGDTKIKGYLALKIKNGHKRIDEYC